MFNTMDIFISWSGERSRAIAEAIREWLPKIMNSVKPWMSQTDISKGSRWNPDIARNLDSAKAGIFCLTPSNLKSESILFEAGAISKSVSESRVYTLLAGVEIAELRWPLAQFQATSLNQDEIRKMLQDINKDLLRLGEPASPEEILEEAFDLWWPKLEDKLSKLPPDVPRAMPARSERDILEEILELARGQTRFVGHMEDLVMLQERARHENQQRHADERAYIEELQALLNDRDRRLWNTSRSLLVNATLSDFKNAVCAALSSANENAALELLKNGTWSRNQRAVVVQTDLSKTTLDLIINPHIIHLATKAISELGEKLQFQVAGSGTTQKPNSALGTQ
jgi:TIR domain